mmetsp:Transcript_28281/g.64061  ORF Transcript_28281/g.64061 Transcript_28281/m.64061 type:complete len:213 (+) Transcript_28281:865-1503(+)
MGREAEHGRSRHERIPGRGRAKAQGRPLQQRRHILPLQQPRTPPLPGCSSRSIRDAGRDPRRGPMERRRHGREFSHPAPLRVHAGEQGGSAHAAGAEAWSGGMQHHDEAAGRLQDDAYHLRHPLGEGGAGGGHAGGWLLLRHRPSQQGRVVSSAAGVQQGNVARRVQPLLATSRRRAGAAAGSGRELTAPSSGVGGAHRHREDALGAQALSS